MEHANATPVITLDLTNAHGGYHDRKLYASSVTRFLAHKSTFAALAAQHDVGIFLPSAAAIEAGSPLIEVVGTAEHNEAARKDIINIVRALVPARFKIVTVDSLLHRYLTTGKNGTRIKAFEKRGVDMILPTEAGASDILLAFSGEGAPEQVLEGEGGASFQ